jgi:hypothetical protein
VLSPGWSSSDAAVATAASDTSEASRTALPCPARMGRVIDERVVRCEECRLVWLPVDERRWRAYWIDDGPEEKLLFYCPDYAEREFSPN